MVFQHFSLLPWRTAIHNVEFPLQIQGVDKAIRREQSERYLELVGLGKFRNHRPYELSGGMQQRVGLARALAVEPDLLLMDEPFGSLDQQTAERLRDELLRIRHELRTTILIVTHNIDEAIYLGDRIILLGGSPAGVAGEFRVRLPQRRWEHNIYAEPAFAELRQVLREALLPVGSE
jgi:NitT/TauT family transport system ATP-binding protein